MFACSDLMALGAIEAIAAAGKTGKITGARLRRARRCEEGDRGGTMEATVAQFPDEMGASAVESAVKAFKGEHGASRTSTCGSNS